MMVPGVSAGDRFEMAGQPSAGVMEYKPMRGNFAVRRMQSWKEMADWLRDFDNHWYLKATEISRMWTHIVQARPPAVPLAVPMHRRALLLCQRRCGELRLFGAAAPKPYAWRACMLGDAALPWLQLRRVPASAA